MSNDTRAKKNSKNILITYVTNDIIIIINFYIVEATDNYLLISVNAFDKVAITKNFTNHIFRGR